MEIDEMIDKVHETLEGRYDLTGYDLYMIHGTLCEYANDKKMNKHIGFVSSTDSFDCDRAEAQMTAMFKAIGKEMFEGKAVLIVQGTGDQAMAGIQALHAMGAIKPRNKEAKRVGVIGHTEFIPAITEVKPYFLTTPQIFDDQINVTTQSLKDIQSRESRSQMKLRQKHHK